MKILTNYIKDLQKSKSTPLLIELSKKDLDSMSVKGVCGVNISLVLAKELYDANLKNTTETNLIYIDADNVNNLKQIYLFEEFLKLIEKDVKNIKNLNIAKEGISQGLSYVTGGLVNKHIGEFINESIMSVLGDFHNELTDFILDSAVLKQIDLGDKFSTILEEKAFEILNDRSITYLDNIKDEPLYLSSESKSKIEKLSKYFKKDLTPAESFRLVLQLMLSVAVDMPKVLYIKNPHKLDKNSLAILSLLFSFAKDIKSEGKHTNISVIYTYEDEEYQPYTKVTQKYEDAKTFLDDLRRYTQRYAMLERPTSDIPHIAVKSSMFVGRKEELEKLNARYIYSKKHKNITTLDVVSGEPGIGKTKLIKKHLEDTRKEENEGSKQIQMTLLNHVGHTSSNTGIGSLIDSILKEAQRLEEVKTFKEKLSDYINSKAKESVPIFIKKTLGIDAFVKIGTVLKDRIDIESQMEQTQLNTRGDLDNKSKDKKDEQFNNLDISIKKLLELSDDSMPIILFIDDLQWIDEDASEYIIKHFIEKFNVHIVASIRYSDATTTLKKAYENKEQNLYKIALLNTVETRLEYIIISDIKIDKINFNATHLLGFDSNTLQSLISKVIQGDKDYQEILARAIIKELNNDKNKDEVNTLFAVETINMLCDEKLYTSQDEANMIKQLILTDTPLRFNTELTNFQKSLEHTFKILNDKYKIAFEHINTDQDKTEFNQKFSLMAYAVLEERLNILKIYFGKHGNAAVNTLLFSSLLGIPFNSIIVENILDALATTNEELLQPLKEYILEANDEITLNETHYEIIEEVYEILSRYQAFNSVFTYRHSLLNIFLDKQLEYQLGDIFKKNTIDAINKLYTLILYKINDEEKIKDFYGEHEGSLDRKKYENMLFYKQTEQNVLNKAYKKDPILWAKHYTISLNNLALSYNNINQTEKAISLQKEVLEITKELYTDNPKRWVKIYILSLNNLALSYNSINQTKKAIALQKEALDTSKAMYKNNPEKWAENYTRNLNNLAASYFNSSLLEKAIVLQEEALDITKPLYVDNPERWAEDYIRSLNNLAMSYNNSDQTERAIHLQYKVLDITKPLYVDNPERWAEFYITSLNNLAMSYNNSDQTERAITLEGEALDITKILYENNPGRWAEAYTKSLNNIANSYKNINQTERAITLEGEALDITKILYENNPERWAENYTTSLNNMAMFYSNNQTEKAILLYKEALEILKTMYKTNHTRWSGNYISSLNNLSSLYNDTNQTKKEIALQEEALEITKELYIDNPERWAEDYIRSLSNLAVFYYKYKDKTEKAIALQEEVLEITKELYAGNPERWAKDYTICLNNLASSYKNNNQSARAMTLEEEALEIIKELYADNSERWAEGYITGLNNLASSYKNNNQSARAMTLEEEALEIIKALYENNPERWAGDYTISLSNIAISHSNINQTERALALEEEALDITKILYENNPQIWVEAYIRSLSNLAGSYYDSNQRNKAIALQEEALEIIKVLYENHPERWKQDYIRSLDNLVYLYGNSRN